MAGEHIVLDRPGVVLRLHEVADQLLHHVVCPVLRQSAVLVAKDRRLGGELAHLAELLDDCAKVQHVEHVVVVAERIHDQLKLRLQLVRAQVLADLLHHWEIHRGVGGRVSEELA